MEAQQTAGLSSVGQGWRRIEEAAEVLGVTQRKASGLVLRGPLLGRWWNGTLVVRESDLARFIASRRTW